MNRTPLLFGLVWIPLLVSACAGCDEQEPPFSDVTPALSTSTNRLNIGTVYVGAVHIAEFEIESTGTAAVNVRDIVVAGAGLTLRSTAPGRMTPGSSATVVVSFAPGAEGPLDGSVTLFHDAPTGAETVVSITGTGVFPPECDDDNPCTDNLFDLDQEECITIFLNTACDDQNACTDNDRCIQGECFGQAIACEDDDLACTQGACVAEEGCIQIPRHDLCDDGDPCTNELCDVESGCANPPKAEFTPCGNLVDCVSIDLCIQQTCRTVPIPEGTPCDDVDVCTTGETCQAGFCEGTRVELPPTLIGENRLLAGRQVLVPTSRFGGQRRLSDDSYLLVLSGGLTARIERSTAQFGNLESITYGLAQLHPNGFASDVVTIPEEDRAVFDLGDGAVAVVDYSDPDAPTELGRLDAGEGDGITGLSSDLLARCVRDDPSAIELVDLSADTLLNRETIALDAPRCDEAAEVLVTANHVVLVRPQQVVAYPRNDGIDVSAVRVFPLPQLLGLLNVFGVADAAAEYIFIRGETPASSTPRALALDLTQDDDSVVVGTQMFEPGTFAHVLLSENFVVGLTVGPTPYVHNIPRDFSESPSDVLGTPRMRGPPIQSGDALLSFGPGSGTLVEVTSDGSDVHPMFIMGSDVNSRITSTPEAMWVYGPQSLLRLEREEIESGAHPSMVIGPGFSTEAVTLIDLPSGPAGGVAIVEELHGNGHGVGHCGIGDCQRFGFEEVGADQLNLQRLTVDDIGSTSVAELGTLDVETFLTERGIFDNSEEEVYISAVDVKGCAVAFLAGVDGGDLFPAALVIGDRCSLAGGVVLLQALELPGSFHFASGDMSPRVQIQSASVITVTADLDVFFVDYSDPIVPEVFVSVQLPSPLDTVDLDETFSQWAWIDVAYQPGQFAVTLSGNHAFEQMQSLDRLLVGTIVGDIATFQSTSLSLTRDDGSFAQEENEQYRPRRRVLAFEPPRVYVSATALDDDDAVVDTVRIFSTEGGSVELDQEVVVATEATAALIEDGNVYVGRVDGASMISPPCGPSTPTP